MTTRYHFYCSLQTFTTFEAALKPAWRFKDATFVDTHGRPHMLVPMLQTDIQDWPVLIGTNAVPSDDTSTWRAR
jgi:hypothetical protein